MRHQGSRNGIIIIIIIIIFKKARFTWTWGVDRIQKA